MGESSMLLYQNNSSYFFPACNDLAKPILAHRKDASKYYIMRNLRMGSVVSSLYGSWQNEVEEKKTIVILDSAFDWYLPKHLRRMNPEANLVLLFWNPMSKRGLKMKSYFEQYGTVASYSLSDSSEYGLLYVEPFYCKDYASKYPSENDGGVVFLGLDKGRGSFLSSLAAAIDSCGVKHSFHVAKSNRFGEKYPGLEYFDYSDYVPYEEYCRWAARSFAIADISQPGVNALNLRTLETMFFQKKLITTNCIVEQLDFYEPNNVIVVNECSVEMLSDFLNKPFVPYGEDLLDRYDIRNALSRIEEAIG